MHRRIGYYEGWASSPSSRACDLYLPEQISAEVLTHGERARLWQIFHCQWTDPLMEQSTMPSRLSRRHTSSWRWPQETTSYGSGRQL